MCERVCVIGYYNHNNLGDDQYRQSFKYIVDTYFPKYQLDFFDCDTILSHQFYDTDIIVLGGGDVLNDYFLDKILTRFQGAPNKVLAISVGLPFPSFLAETNKLNIIDYIFVRTQQDMELFSVYFHSQRVYYIPDISCVLSTINDTNNASTVMNRIKTIKSINKKVACFALSRHIANNNIHYPMLIEKLAIFAEYVFSKNYHLMFIPFNTNNNSFENDTLINTDVVNQILKSTSMTMCDVTVINTQFEEATILQLFEYVDIVIPMRFHACLLPLYKQIPIFPIFSTRKVKNLLLDINWKHGYEMETDERFLPIDIDITILKTRFDCLINLPIDMIKQKLQNVTSAFKLDFQKSIKILQNLISNPYDKTIIQNLKSDIKSQFHEKTHDVYSKVQDKFGQVIQFIPEVRRDLAVKFVSFLLTGNTNSPYNFGLQSKMFEPGYDYEAEWEWILKEEQQFKQKLPTNPDGLFNLSYIDQIDRSGAHRHGWQYVFDNIKQMHNESSELLMDLYIDRTFHWDAEINRLLDIIPYRTSWTGFIHHTFDTTFSTYNCVELLKSELFLKSLEKCHGLFVLSRHLQNKMTNELAKLNILHVPVFFIAHPTELNVEKFSMQKYVNNTDKKLLHVGGWLRNVYSFYTLEVPSQFRKVALKGMSMNNYYPHPDFTSKLAAIDEQSNFVRTLAPCVSTQNISSGSNTNSNNWFRHFYQDILHKLESVFILSHQSNEEYDQLLTENIVYVYLIEPSAVNTLIECVARCTPIIVNKCEAAVEVLGNWYPLYVTNCKNFFEFNQQVIKLLSNKSKIKCAHRYLSFMNKSHLSIKAFQQELTNVCEVLHINAKMRLK